MLEYLTNFVQNDMILGNNEGGGGFLQGFVGGIQRFFGSQEQMSRQFEGSAQQGISFLLILFPAFVIYMNLLGETTSYYARYMGYGIFLIYLLYPRTNSKVKHVNYLPWYDVLAAVLSIATFYYYVWQQGTKTTYYVSLDWGKEILIGTIALLLLAEACRRVLGNSIIWVFLFFFTIALCMGRPITRIIYDVFYTEQGLIGDAAKVCATYITLFSILAAFLESIGVNDFFVTCAQALLGGSAGGSAKVEVLSSALCGMVSGSSVENTLSTGRKTIPMMQKNGFSPSFSAAVSASASVGGQIMPPIMGSAAFLMAELNEIPYSSLLGRAVLPAFLYFLGIFFMVHFKAKKLHLSGVETEDMPSREELLDKLYLLLPIMVLVVLLVMGCPVMETVMFATFLCVVLGVRDEECPMDFSRFCRAMEQATKNSLPVAVACGMAGAISGIVTTTGLGSYLVSAVVSVAGHHLWIALILTMCCCLTLGMAVPTIANYAIIATIFAPILIDGMGVDVILANMFVFYFAIVADVTPPVSVASQVAANIGKSSHWKTAVRASVLSIGGFIIPYMFVFHPELLFMGHNLSQLPIVLVTTISGLFAISIGVVGYFYDDLSILQRVQSILAGLLLVLPEFYSDTMGIVLLLLIVSQQYLQKKKEANLPI